MTSSSSQRILSGCRSLTFVVLLLTATPLCSQTPPIKNAKDLVRARLHFDKTVWSPEVVAQKYEDMFVQLWDDLLQKADKFQVLRDFEFDSITLPTNFTNKEIDHGIKIETGTASKELTHQAYKDLLGKLESSRQSGTIKRSSQPTAMRQQSRPFRF